MVSVFSFFSLSFLKNLPKFSLPSKRGASENGTLRSWMIYHVAFDESYLLVPSDVLDSSLKAVTLSSGLCDLCKLCVLHLILEIESKRLSSIVFLSDAQGMPAGN